MADEHVVMQVREYYMLIVLTQRRWHFVDTTQVTNKQQNEKWTKKDCIKPLKSTCKKKNEKWCDQFQKKTSGERGFVLFATCF